MNEEGTLDFNFWPSFADLMLAVVLVLVLVLFLTTAVITVGKIDLSGVEKNQQDMVKAIAVEYRSEPKKLDDTGHKWGISSDKSDKYDIEIQNDLNQQRITFGDKVLFEQDHVEITDNGRKVLTAVGQNVKHQLGFLREIQIRGHADTKPTGRFRDNVQLAAERAMTVFEFFRSNVGIDPTRVLISATSFGEYDPALRSDTEVSYTWERLRQDNSSEELRSKNRRIELVLVYRR